MSRTLVKDNAAESDLVGIWLYSFDNWGQAQADRYLDALERGIVWVSNNVESGNDRRPLREGYWSVRVKQHVAFYTFSDTEVRIRRLDCSPIPAHEALQIVPSPTVHLVFRERRLRLHTPLLVCREKKVWLSLISSYS